MTIAGIGTAGEKHGKNFALPVDLSTVIGSEFLRCRTMSTQKDGISLSQEDRSVQNVNLIYLEMDYVNMYGRVVDDYLSRKKEQIPETDLTAKGMVRKLSALKTLANNMGNEMHALKIKFAAQYELSGDMVRELHRLNISKFEQWLSGI